MCANSGTLSILVGTPDQILAEAKHCWSLWHRRREQTDHRSYQLFARYIVEALVMPLGLGLLQACLAMYSLCVPLLFDDIPALSLVDTELFFWHKDPRRLHIPAVVYEHSVESMLYKWGLATKCYKLFLCCLRFTVLVRTVQLCGHPQAS